MIEKSAGILYDARLIEDTTRANMDKYRYKRRGLKLAFISFKHCEVVCRNYATFTDLKMITQRFTDLCSRIDKLAHDLPILNVRLQVKDGGRLACCVALKIRRRTQIARLQLFNLEPVEFHVDEVAARAHVLAALSTVHRAIVEFEIEFMNGKSCEPSFLLDYEHRGVQKRAYSLSYFGRVQIASLT